MNEETLKAWSQTLLAACALTFLLGQARSGFVEGTLLKMQNAKNRGMLEDLAEELAQINAKMTAKEAQLQKAKTLEKKYGLVLDDLVQASRTDADAWAITQKWKIKPDGGQPIPPPQGMLQGAPARSTAKPQAVPPSLSTPFIPANKPTRDKSE